MKKIIQILSLSTLAFVGLTSCEDDTTILNNDPKNPVTVPSLNVLTTASYYLVNQHVSPSVNENITRFFTQQWTETTYTGETNYYFDQRNQNQFHFNNMFREVIAPLAKAKTYVANESEDLSYTSAEVAKIKANKIAIMEILSVFAWANLVDSYGDIPYSEALKSDANDLILQPKYDDAATIYADLEKRINAAIASISVDLPSYYGSSSDDSQQEQFYPKYLANGDEPGMNMDHWIKVANTIKLQMGLNLADVNNVKARILVESAVAGGVITTNGDTLQFLFDSGQFTNPIYQNLVASGRNDFLPSNVLVDYMKAQSDPRVPQYFTLAPDGTYKGGVYGTLNTYGNFSKVADKIKSSTAPGVVFDPVDVKFMLAEAAARNFNVGGSASSYYTQAVTASMTQWNVTGTDTAAYLAAHPYNAANWKQSIGEAAWVAMYNRGFEAWNFWRRLDYPVLNNAPTAEHGLVRRMPYPLNEKNNNAANVAAASAKISGGDIYSSRVFWDKN